MSLGNIGTLFVQLRAEGAKQAEKDILNVEGAFNKAAKSLISKTPSVEYFLKRWGVALGAVSLAAGGLYALIKAGPVAYTYWEEFGNLIGAVSDTIVSALSPAIDAVLNSLWSMESLFEKLPEPVQAAIGVLAIVGGSILALSLIVGTAATGFGVLMGILAPVVVAISGLILPILAVVATVAFFYIAWKEKWLSIQEIAISVIGIVAGFLLGGPIGAAIAFLLTLIYTAWKNNWFGIRDIAHKVVQAISDKITEFKNWILERWNDIKAGVVEVWDKIQSGAQWLWDEMVRIFTGIYNSVVDTWTRLKNWIASNPIIQVIKTVYDAASIFRASGGPVTGGTPYIVGEKGPELFIPSSSGSIIPNSQLGNSGGQSITLINKIELDGRQLWQSVRQYSSAELRRLGGY